MANEKIKIICPVCGAVLMVRNIPGIETKNVTCPNCKKLSPFTKFKTVFEEEEKTRYANEEPKQQTPAQVKLGKINVPSLGMSFQLKLGKNLIGRKSPNSSSDIQLECSNRVSRNHLVIDVMGDAANGFSYGVSLYKENVNPTFINGTQLEFGDCLILNNGDKIGLPDIDLVFEN